VREVFATGQIQKKQKLHPVNGRWLEISAFPLVNESGEVILVADHVRDITESQRAAEALRESEARFKTLFEHAPDAFFLMNQQGKFLDVNRSVEELSGYDREEAIGQDYRELGFFDEQQNLMAQTLLSQGVDGIPMGPVEFSLRRKDGGVVFIEIKGLPMRIQGESLLLGIARDITARKRAEAALRDSEERYRTLFETSPDALIVMDLDMNLIMANQRSMEMIGYDSLEQAMSRRGIDNFAWEDRPRVMATVKEMMATGRTQTFETTMVRRDGARFPSLNSAALIQDAAGNPQAILGVARDITGIKETEADLRESMQKFRLISETIQDVFWISTPGIEKMVYVSPAYEEIWGRPLAELVQSPQTFLEGVHPEDREQVRAEILANEACGTPWSHEYRVVKPDGAVRWIQGRGFPVQDDQGRIIWYTGVATDVTERKTLEQQFLQAQKMEAVGRLAGGVAHDFNNLLMAIMGYGELMRSKVNQKDPLYGHLENIIKAGDKAVALVQQLLAFSRRQIVHPQLIDLRQVLVDLEPMLRRLIGEDIELEILTGPRPAAMRGDSGHLGQVIMNLVVNARDAMPRGGRLTIEAAAVDFSLGCHTRFGLTPPGAYVALKVRDTGEGMDEATQARIFEPFFSTKEPGKGTGLGLSTVYGIVKQSGGYLDVDSEPGKGSAFIIHLPRLEAPVQQPKVTMAIIEGLRGEETILLVEDEDVLRIMLAKFLRLYGYAVLEARHGGEALLICERHQGPIHLLVTDVVMPQMSGRELADRLAPLRREMQVLYMSGYTDDEVVHHGVRDSSVSFLQKPFKPIELARQVRGILERQSQA